MDERPDVPLRAWGAVVPLFSAHAGDQRGEPAPAAAMQLDKIIFHAYPLIARRWGRNLPLRATLQHDDRAGRGVGTQDADSSSNERL